MEQYRLHGTAVRKESLVLMQRAQVHPWLWVGLAVLLSMIACSSPYRFQYRYTMVEPPGGSEGIEDDRVRIRLNPIPDQGILDLALSNKSTQPIAIVWNQTHFVDPFGRRQQATEAGVNWFFKPMNWFSDQVAVAPGDNFRTRVQAGRHQSYNPFSITRQAGGTVHVSSSPRSLLPTSGTTSTIGETYQGRTFQFMLVLQVGEEEVQYPFKFRITNVEVEGKGEKEK